ncbi:Uncharacterized protein FWK35_00015419, partial [Aphis craccivora]
VKFFSMRFKILRQHMRVSRPLNCLSAMKYHGFSSSVEVQASELLISAKAMANRFSSNLNKSESPPEAPRCAEGSEAAGNSDGPSKSSEGPEIQSSHSVRLPEIPLPHFEGELADWPVFRDRFIALVDSRSNISNIEKLYYLLSCLQCEASDVVKGITVSNDTYSIAWAALVERYDQPRRLASSLIDSILSAPIMQQESVGSLNKFLCTFDEDIAILESLEIPNLGDFLLFSVAFRYLPILSRRIFEKYFDQNGPPPILSSESGIYWRLGRVIELLPGQDNVVRVVRLLTGQGTLVRPVVKLVR